jgi:hypothetical protein
MVQKNHIQLESLSFIHKIVRFKVFGESKVFRLIKNMLLLLLIKQHKPPLWVCNPPVRKPIYIRVDLLQPVLPTSHRVVAAHVLIVLTAVRARACRPYGNEKGLLSLRVTDSKPYAAVACYNSLTTPACTRGCCGGNVLMHGPYLPVYHRYFFIGRDPF